MTDQGFAFVQARHDGWTTSRRETFIEVLRATCSVTTAARAVELSTTSAYRLRARDAEFASSWAAALDEATDELEAVLRRRVIEGVERPIVRGNKVVATMRDYSDRLAMHLLTMRRSGKNGAVQTANPSPTDEVPSWKRGEDARMMVIDELDRICLERTGKPYLPPNHPGRRRSGDPPLARTREEYEALQNVEYVQENDDRDRDTDQPE